MTKKNLIKRNTVELQNQLKDIENSKDFDILIDDLEPYNETEYVSSFQDESIAPEKITQCCTCLNLCHNPCSLDGVYSRGDGY